MKAVLILSRADVEQCLDLDQMVDALAEAMVDLSSGKASVPPRIGARAAAQDSILLAMPAYLPAAKVLCTKLVGIFPHNKTLPTHPAIITLFDPETGEPIALMDGAYITATRTAGGSALSAKLLACEDAEILAILGTGVQARAHARAIPKVRGIKEIRIAGRNPEKVAQLAAEIGSIARACDSYEEAIRGADIVCATTHPSGPVVQWEWLKPGAHVTSVGHSDDHAEIDTATITRSRIFVEQRTAGLAAPPTGSMDLYPAIRDGLITAENIAEIGEVISGVRPGRQSADEVTLYKSVGVAVQDAAAAALVLKSARTRSLGTNVSL